MGALEYGVFGEFLAAHPRLCLDTAFAFLPRLGNSFNLGAGFLERYKDRILYGSDFPNIILPRESEIDTLLGYGLSEEFYRRVFDQNGRRLIEPGPDASAAPPSRTVANPGR